MAIDDEKRYEFITEQLRYVNEKIIEAFTLFVKLTSAIMAGIVWNFYLCRKKIAMSAFFL